MFIKRGHFSRSKSSKILKQMDDNEEMVLMPGIKFNEEELKGAKETKEEIFQQPKSIYDESTLRKFALDQRTELLNHLHQIKQSAEDVHGIFEKVYAKVNEDTKLSLDGFEILQVRNHCLCEYLENLALYAELRCNGANLETIEESITGLANNRCVVEKIKPLEKQLQYKMQKLEELEKSNGQISRANPDAMLQAVEQTGEDGEQLVSAEYQAPKFAATLYPKAESDARKEARYAKSIRARTKADALIDEVAADLTEDPLEFGRRQHANREMKEFIKKQKEIEKYEEEHFVRIQRSKKDKAMMKKMEQMQGSLDSILDYGHIQSDAQREKKRQEMKKQRRNK